MIGMNLMMILVTVFKLGFFKILFVVKGRKSSGLRFHCHSKTFDEEVYMYDLIQA